MGFFQKIIVILQIIAIVLQISADQSDHAADYKLLQCGVIPSEDEMVGKIGYAYSVVDPRDERSKFLSPIVLLHGLASSKGMWWDMANVLSKSTGRKVLSMDAPNHGFSSWVEEFDYDSLANSLEDFMFMHNVSKPILIGEGMGARIALTLAIRAANEVEKLILHDLTTTGKAESVENFLHYLAVLRQAIKKIPGDMDEKTAKELLLKIINENVSPERKYQAEDQRKFRLSFMDIKKNAKDKWAWRMNLDGIEKAVKDGEMNQYLHGNYDDKALIIFYNSEHGIRLSGEEQLVLKHLPNALWAAIPSGGATCLGDVYARLVSEYINGEKNELYNQYKVSPLFF